jgi:hypothetical protein
MEVAAEALSSKLVACHCESGSGNGRKMVLLRARLRHAKFGRFGSQGEGR